MVGVANDWTQLWRDRLDRIELVWTVTLGYTLFATLALGLGSVSRIACAIRAEVCGFAREDEWAFGWLFESDGIVAEPPYVCDAWMIWVFRVDFVDECDEVIEGLLEVKPCVDGVDHALLGDGHAGGLQRRGMDYG